MSFGTGFLVHPDLFPGRCAGESWGDRSLALDVPGGPYLFSGLSSIQEEGVRRRFGPLCGPPAGPGIETHVYAAPADAFRSLDVRGWDYTLDLDHFPQGVRLAGLRLMARLDLDPLAGGLWTCEASGDHFAPALENYFRALTAYRLLELGGALLHGAAMVDGDAAFLLLGASGAGKSTAARLCQERGARVLSDDLNAVILPESGPAQVAKLPFTGDLDPLGGAGLDGGGGGSNPEIPLAALFRLEQGSENRLTPLAPARALATLLACAPYVNRDPWRQERLLAFLERLAREVPAYTLTFALDGGLWAILRAIRP